MNHLQATRADLDSVPPGRLKWFEDATNTRTLARPTLDDVRALSEIQKVTLDDLRTDLHRSIGPIKTPQNAALQEWVIARVRKAGRTSLTKPTLFIQGGAGLGKTRTMAAIGRKCHLQDIATYGEWTGDGALRIPVVWITLPDSATTHALVRAIALFFGIPGWAEMSTDRLFQLVRVWIVRHETQIVMIDEVHFAHHYGKAGKAMNDHLKALCNELPITLMLIGIDLKGFMWEGHGPNNTRSQMSLRSRSFTLTGFKTETAAQRKGWIESLIAVESKLLLANVAPGTLSVTHALYLLGRSNQHTGSVMDTIVEAAANAMINGREDLTLDDFRSVDLSDSADASRLRHLEIQTTTAEVSEWIRTGRLPERADASKWGR